MPKYSQQDVVGILELTNRSLAASSESEFMEGLREGFQALSKRLLTSPHKKRYSAALEQAFEQTVASRRQRNILELCTWPIFDKPAAPAAGSGELPEFLWIFCMPMVVHFSQKVGDPLLFPAEAFDGRSVLRRAIAAEWLNPKALLTGFPTLVSREDLHRYGPMNIASFFIQAELGSAPPLQPLPLFMDSEIESGKTRTFFMLAAARLTAGEKELFCPNDNWPAQDISSVVHNGLLASGLAVERVESLAPCSIAEALFRCTPAGTAELDAALAAAIEHYSIKAVSLSFPAEGMAELSGFDAAGEDFLLCSPFSFVEPKPVMRKWVEAACQRHLLAFKGAFSLALPSGSMTH